MTAHNHIMTPSTHIFVHYHKLNQWTLTLKASFTLGQMCASGIQNMRRNGVHANATHTGMWQCGAQCIKCLIRCFYSNVLLFFCFGALRLCELLAAHYIVIYPSCPFQFRRAVGLIAAIKQFYRSAKVVHMLTDWAEYFSSYFQQSHISIAYTILSNLLAWMAETNKQSDHQKIKFHWNEHEITGGREWVYVVMTQVKWPNERETKESSNC